MRKLVKANRVNSVGYKKGKKTKYRENKSKIGESRERKVTMKCVQKLYCKFGATDLYNKGNPCLLDTALRYRFPVFHTCSLILFFYFIIEYLVNQHRSVELKLICCSVYLIKFPSLWMCFKFMEPTLLINIINALFQF